MSLHLHPEKLERATDKAAERIVAWAREKEGRFPVPPFAVTREVIEVALSAYGVPELERELREAIDLAHTVTRDHAKLVGKLRIAEEALARIVGFVSSGFVGLYASGVARRALDRIRGVE